MVTVYSGNECRQPIEIARSVPNDVLKRNLELLAPRKGFDIEIEIGSFSIGGGLFGPTSTGVIIYHKKHKRKYHSFIVEIKEAYGQTFLYTHFGGRSSNAMSSQMDKTRYSVYGGDVYQHTPGVIGRAMAAHGRAGLQEEELYYDQLFTLVGEAIRFAYDNPDAYSTPPQEPARPASAPKQSAPKAVSSAPKSAPSAPKSTPSAPKTASTASTSTVFSNLTAASKKGTPNSAPAATNYTPAPVTHNANGSVNIDARLVLRGQTAGTLFKNEEALGRFHPQIHSALMNNPIYRTAAKTNRTDLSALAAVLERYARSYGLSSCSFGRNFPKSFCYFGKEDVYAMFWGTTAFGTGFADNGYVVTGDWFCQFTNYQENFRISLAEIRSITLQGGRIYINNQPLLFDNDPTQQYNLLVYTIGTLLSMKYPGNTATSVGTAHTGSLSAQQSGSQNVDGTYRFVNPKLKKNQ